jgi:hypothetical protein
MPAVLAATLASCGKWNEPESLAIHYPAEGEINGPLWEQYLAELKAYKQSDHKLLIGWFDNSDKNPSSRAGRLVSLPDSVDVVSLLSPDDLTTRELADFAVLKQKSTRIIYTIDYEAFRRDIEKQMELAADTGGVYEPDWMALTDEFMKKNVALLDKYSYDGASILYEGHSVLSMSQADVDSLTRQQAIIFDAMTALKNSHADKLFMMEGYPQYVLDKTHLAIYDYIAVKSYNEVSVGDVNFVAIKAMAQGVPIDRMILTVYPREVGKDDDPRGFFVVDGQQLPAITETAYWMSLPSVYRKAGLGIMRINDDYYNAELDYKSTREAIKIMNR